MNDLLSVAVGVGLAVGLIFAEFFGLAAGGLIVPGYLALALPHPGDVVLTLGAGWLTFAVVSLLARHTVLFGRRRSAVTILVGYLLGALARGLSTPDADGAVLVPIELHVVGFIIPGLIGLWMARQGVLATVASILIVASMVRLLLVVALGDGMLPT